LELLLPELQLLVRVDALTISSGSEDEPARTNKLAAAIGAHSVDAMCWLMQCAGIS
jgi:hypothetical protein